MAQTTSGTFTSLCRRALESTVGHMVRTNAWSISETKPPRIGEVPLPQCVYALVSGDQIKILVKLHFSGRSRLMPQRADMTSGRADHQNEMAFREVCNVLAGRLKAELSEKGLVLGQSLPVAVDALDEILNPVQEGYPDQAAWRIDAGDGQMLATFHWQVNGEEIDRALENAGSSVPPDNSGAIELF
ncbi:hypothetical protein EBR21_02675 [bacterium]|nr:hypothetical protein [bacterium]